MPTVLEQYRRSMIPAVPRPWKPVVADSTARTVTHLMGQVDCMTGPNPKMTVNGYNLFDVNPNDRPAFYLLTDKVVTGTCTFTAPSTVTLNGHTFAVGGTVVFTTTGTLPTGLTEGVTYYVQSIASNTFTVSATSGGAALTFTGSGSGTHTVSVPLYDATRKALRIEGTNSMGYSCEEYAIFSGMAENIDSSSVKVDVSWTVKVWFDSFVESRVVVHGRENADYTIKFAFLEWQFDHAQVKHFRAPYGGSALCPFVQTNRSSGFSYDENNFLDAAISYTHPWKTGAAYTTGEKVLYNMRTWVAMGDHTAGAGNAPGLDGTWALTTSGNFARPHEFETYDLSYPSTFTKFHLWAGSATRNDAVGSGSPATMVRTLDTQLDTYNANLDDWNFPDGMGGLQKPWLMFSTSADNEAGSSTDKGWWFGFESDANHRSGQSMYSFATATPKFHIWLKDGTTGIATVRADIIGATGAEENPAAWTESFPQGRFPNQINAGFTSKAAIDKPLIFEWFWQSTPVKPRNSVNWKHFRMTQRWTREAKNYGEGNSFPNQLPSVLGHTPMSTKPMTHIMDNQFDWMRTGVIAPSKSYYDSHVVNTAAQDWYRAWAQLYRRPAADLGGKTMPNVPLSAGVFVQSADAGLWPPTEGTRDKWGRYPLTPWMDPEVMMEVVRFDRGKIRVSPVLVGPMFSSTNLGAFLDVDWSAPKAAAYILEEVRHALSLSDIGALYFDICEVTRNDNPFRTSPYSVINKQTLQYGIVASSHINKVELSNTSKTYLQYLVDEGNPTAGSVTSGRRGIYDAWGNAITLWPLRDSRAMMLAAYREAEAQGKVIVGHPFGDMTPPLHGFVHYLLFGEEMVGTIGVGWDDFNRYPGTNPFTTISDPYGTHVPNHYWSGLWACGTAPVFLPEFGRVTGTPGTPMSSYVAQFHSDDAWNGLLAKLNTYEVQLFCSEFVTTRAWATSTGYVKDDVVYVGNNVFVCKLEHTSGAITTANSTYWANIGTNGIPAALISAWWDQAGTWRA